MTICSTITQSFATTKVLQTVPMTILYLSLSHRHKIDCVHSLRRRRVWQQGGNAEVNGARNTGNPGTCLEMFYL